jgi:hypothetical protein
VVERRYIKYFEVLNDEGVPGDDNTGKEGGTFYLIDSEDGEEDVEAGCDEVPSEKDDGFANSVEDEPSVQAVESLYAKQDHAESPYGVFELDFK